MHTAQVYAGFKPTIGQRVAAIATLVLAYLVATPLQAQTSSFEPRVGQEGKDVVWVPTPEPLVQRMLDMAEVKPNERLLDLGSGDGRTVIAAAQRGLEARGVEYNPDMVALAKRRAEEAGVAHLATFEEGDLFQTDFSDADVITMFLLPSINEKLMPTLLALEPGTRIVSNSFRMGDWEPDQTDRTDEDCTRWCSALLWIVPAQVHGTWRTDDGYTLELEQTYQMLAGTLSGAPLQDGRLRGDEIRFRAGNDSYVGAVNGDIISGVVENDGRVWRATRNAKQ